MSVPQSSPAAGSFEKFLKIIVFFLVSVFLLFFFIRSLEVGDNWWQLATGKFIFEHNQFPRIDPFSFSGEKTPWIFSQWLGSLIFYCVFLLGGNVGLGIFRASVFLACIAIFIFYAQKRLPAFLLLLWIFVMCFGLVTRLFLRPDIFNILFIPLFLIILFNHQNNSNPKMLFFLPVLTIVWFNLHLGCIVYGMPLLAIFLFSASIKYFQLKKGRTTETLNIAALRKKIKELILIFIGCIASFLINPYTLAGALYPFKVFFMPDYIRFYKFVEIISENFSPVYILTIRGVWFPLIALLTILGLSFSKKNKLPNTLLFLFSLFLFLYGERASILFVLVSSYVFVECLADISFKENWRQWKFARTINVGVYAIMVFIISIAIFRTLNVFNVHHYAVQREVSFSLHPTNPETAVKLLKTNHINGRVFNTHHYGGYLLWEGYPSLKPFIDGRQLNKERFQTYLNVLRDPQKQWPLAEKIYQFDIVLLSFDQAHAKILRYLSAQPSWQLMAVDGNSILFIKKGRFSLPQEIGGYENYLKNMKIPEPQKNLTRKELFFKQNRSSSFVKKLFGPSYLYFDLEQESLALWFMGYPEASLKKLFDALKINDSQAMRNMLLQRLNPEEKLLK